MTILAGRTFHAAGALLGPKAGQPVRPPVESMSSPLALGVPPDRSGIRQNFAMPGRVALDGKSLTTSTTGKFTRPPLEREPLDEQTAPSRV